MKCPRVRVYFWRKRFIRESTNGTRRAGTHHTAAVKNPDTERYPRAKGLRLREGGVGLGSGSQSLRLIMCALYPP